jgi:hypothetical protein
LQRLSDKSTHEIICPSTLDELKRIAGNKLYATLPERDRTIAEIWDKDKNVIIHIEDIKAEETYYPITIKQKEVW